MASYFGVSLFYLRGETNDTTQMSDWMDGAFLDEPAPVPAPRRAAVKPAVAASSGGEGGTMFDAFLTSKKFQEALRTAVLDTLRTPEGQELLTKAIRKELANRQMLRAGSLALAAFHAVRRPASGRGVRRIVGVSVGVHLPVVHRREQLRDGDVFRASVNAVAAARAGNQVPAA